MFSPPMQASYPAFTVDLPPADPAPSPQGGLKPLLSEVHLRRLDGEDYLHRRAVGVGYPGTLLTDMQNPTAPPSQFIFCVPAHRWECCCPQMREMPRCVLTHWIKFLLSGNCVPSRVLRRRHSWLCLLAKARRIASHGACSAVNGTRLACLLPFKGLCRAPEECLRETLTHLPPCGHGGKECPVRCNYQPANDCPLAAGVHNSHKPFLWNM